MSVLCFVLKVGYVSYSHPLSHIVQLRMKIISVCDFSEYFSPLPRQVIATCASVLTL